MSPSSTFITRLKVSLKLSISRLRMIQQKETALAKAARRQMAQLLEVGKEESAKIRVENVIRQDITVELFEILELYCELLVARIGLLDGKECDPGLEEAVKTLIYAAPRTDVKELNQIRQLLVEKFGKEFALEAIENTDGKVSERVLKKLRVEAPAPELVTSYLDAIRETYELPPKASSPGSDNGDPSGGLKELAEIEEGAALKEAELIKATPPKQLRSPINVAPPSPSSENVHPVVKFPEAPKQLSQAQPKPVPPKSKPSLSFPSVPNDDDLARRFAALKKG